MTRYDEEKLQIWCVNYLTYNYSHLLWHHSPNEGKRSELQGKYLKQCGMQTGWPDLEILDGHKVVFVEFKTPNGRQSAEQKKIQGRIEEMGMKYIICRTREEFIALCRIHFGQRVDPDINQLKKILGQ